MRQPYNVPKGTPESQALAERVVEVLIESRLSFQDIDDALTIAQDILVNKTRPVLN